MLTCVLLLAAKCYYPNGEFPPHMRSPFSTSCSDACQAAINSASESVRAACKDADIKTSQALDSVYVSVALMQPACEYPGGSDITPPPCFF